MDKLIITAAVTGSRITKEQCPNIPITPEEIVQSCVECRKAGASVVHIHVRDPKTGQGTQDLDVFRRVVDGVREKTDLILCLTTSGIPGRNLPTEQRLLPVSLKPELASLDCGTINLGGVFENTPEFLDAAAKMMMEKGVKPEVEVFDTGMIVAALRMLEEKKLQEPLHFQFVLGTAFGAPATAKALLNMREMIPANATWSVIGIGKGQLPVNLMALVMGGHVRVGMEDNIYYKRGELAKSNAQFVERIVRIAGEYGRDVASPADARQILGLKPRP